MNKKRPMPSILSILGPEKGAEEGDGPSPGEIDQCAHELVQAVHARDVTGVVEAFKAMFACCESEPHEEYGEK